MTSAGGNTGNNPGQPSPIDLTRIEETLQQMYDNDSENNNTAVDKLQEDQQWKSLLEQRERDLILAAEVGKALLQQNQELQTQSECLTHEYNQRLESLEQEKYALRRRLETAEAEYESRVLELQNDVSSLRHQLVDEKSNAKSACRDNQQLVQELTEQNQRLTQQLKQVSKAEEHVSQQLNSLREQFNLRRLALHEHIQQLESLREEIQQLTEKKIELERRINVLTDERDSLAENLEETSCKALLLERQKKEADHQMRLKEMELVDVKRENTVLKSRVHELQSQTFMGHQGAAQNSLFNELEMAEQLESDDFQVNSPLCGGQYSGTAVTPTPSGFHFDLEDDEDDNIECDDDFEPVPDENDLNSQDMQFYARLYNSDDERTYHLKQEILKVYKQIRTIAKPGERAYEAIGGAEDRSQALLAASTIGPDILLLVLTELKGLMEDIVTREIELAKHLKEVEESKLLADQQTSAAKAHLDSVKEQVAFCRQRLEEMSMQLEQRHFELKKKDEELAELREKMMLQRSQLNQIFEERNMIKSDRDSLERSKDEAISKAWSERDEAIEKKINVEVELTKAQIELMTLDSQLMEAIQQKIRLSQQLEQWQMDMASVIEDQVRSKLDLEAQKRKEAKALAEAAAHQAQAHKKTPSWLAGLLSSSSATNSACSISSSLTNLNPGVTNGASIGQNSNNEVSVQNISIPQSNEPQSSVEVVANFSEMPSVVAIETSS